MPYIQNWPTTRKGYMKLRISYLLFAAFVIHSGLANAGSCRRITNEISDDLARYSGNIKNKHLQWTNFIWLQQQLGAADEKNITNGKIKYRWRCEPEGSYLVAVVDVSGNLLRVNGQYNSDNGTGLFAARIPKTDTSLDPITPEIKTSTPVIIPASVANAELAERLNQYNSHYKTAFQTTEDIQNDMAQRIKHYYSSLRLCQPGTYEFALPVLQSFLYQTAVITEQSEGRCKVKTSYVIPQVGNIDLKCNYQLSSLPLYSDAEAEAAARGATQFDSEHPTALQTVVANECKRYIDGVP
jgi:hypothetical protein